VVDANITAEDAIYVLDPDDGSVLGSFLPTAVPPIDLELPFGLATDGARFGLTELEGGSLKIHRMIAGDIVFYDGFETSDFCEWSARQGGPDC
jgi:hypothetical protein